MLALNTLTHCVYSSVRELDARRACSVQACGPRLALFAFMSFPKSSLACVLALGLAVSTASAAPRAAIRIGPETVPASVDAATRAAFRHVVTSSVAEAGFSPSRAYTAYPTILQLRHYVEPGEKSPTVVCIVSIAVADDEELLIATVRGNATSRGAAARNVLEVATQSAVHSLVEALRSSERSRTNGKPSAKN